MISKRRRAGYDQGCNEIGPDGCLPDGDRLTAPAHAQDAGVTKVITNGPQVSPGDTSPSASARQNVIESKQYERLLQTNRAFREARMRKECGSISDPQLHQSCIASFGQ